MAEYVLPDAVLKSLRSGNLFYPSAGKEVATAVDVFSSWLGEFWFVDKDYSSVPLLANSYYVDGGRQWPADTSRYQLMDSYCEWARGTTIRREEPFEVRIHRETYERAGDGRRFAVCQCCACGYNAFRALLKSTGKTLSVFFYRGDSDGEGGSNFYWLGEGRLRNVLEVLEDGGLIVSDGSKAMRQLRAFHHQNGLGASVMERAESFEFAGRRFKCVGYLGDRYGPTLVWQATKA